MPEASPQTSVLWVVRLLAIGISLYLVLDLTRQCLAGSISMGYGEFNDRIVVTSLLGRTLAMLMWGTFLSGVFLAGARPSLFAKYRWLVAAFLVAIFLWFVLFSVLGDYQLQ